MSSNIQQSLRKRASFSNHPPQAYVGDLPTQSLPTESLPQRQHVPNTSRIVRTSDDTVFKDKASLTFSSLHSRKPVAFLFLVIIFLVLSSTIFLIKTQTHYQGHAAGAISPFQTLPPGSPLPSDTECAASVFRNSWEPRPDNNTANHTTFLNSQVQPTSNPETIYVNRVTGTFTGTTDEIFQWASCKWGIELNWIRAQAVVESDWHQNALGDCNGSPYPELNGCQSLGILQIKGANQPPDYPGTYPYALQSTAFNVDYAMAVRRACFDRKVTWLGNGYTAGDLLGCMGEWFSGDWYSQGAIDYMNKVQQAYNNQTWNTYGAGPAPTFPLASITITPAASTTPTPTPTQIPVVPSTWRIETGNTASYTDSKGNVWAADTGFANGSMVDRGNIAIANTSDPRIYQTEHYGMSSASYAVPNGNYTVNLHFAETYLTAAGQRIFTVAINGTPVLANFDVYSQAGGADSALVKSFSVNVTNGRVTITFTRQVEQPEINGIEILPAVTATPSPTPLPTDALNLPVSTDTMSPTVAITNLLNRSTIKRASTVTLTATASDNVGVTKVEFYVNRSLLCTDTTAPYSCVWSVPGKPHATYTLTAKAYDAAGNTGTNSVSVTAK